MARVSTYLNFMGRTEEAFEYYRSVFGTEYLAPIARMGDVPADPSGPAVAETERDLVMHVELPILGGHVLMGTDLLESMGHVLELGNNMSITLEPDTRAETERLFAALSEEGTDVFGLEEMFWGDLFGSCRDRFGILWMFVGPLTD